MINKANARLIWDLLKQKLDLPEHEYKLFETAVKTRKSYPLRSPLCNTAKIYFSQRRWWVTCDHVDVATMTQHVLNSVNLELRRLYLDYANG